MFAISQTLVFLNSEQLTYGEFFTQLAGQLAQLAGQLASRFLHEICAPKSMYK